MHYFGLQPAGLLVALLRLAAGWVPRDAIEPVISGPFVLTILIGSR